MHVFLCEKVHKKLRLKWPKSSENHEAQFPKLSVFVCQKSIFRHCCFQYVKDRIQIRVYRINNESVALSSQFISVKAKKNFRKSQAQLRLRKHDGFRKKNYLSDFQ